MFLQTFRQFLENWIFDGKSTAADPYKNGENFVLSQNELRKYFFGQNSFVPLSKSSVSTNFKAVFGKLNFWWKIDSRGPYKNGENFVLSQNEAKKIFFGKIICSTHQKKCFYKLLGSFWKIEFLTENRQPRTLQKWWKFCTISKCAKKTFFSGKILCSTQQK